MASFILKPAWSDPKETFIMTAFLFQLAFEIEKHNRLAYQSQKFKPAANRTILADSARKAACRSCGLNF
jgi:hypothetical protein